LRAKAHRLESFVIPHQYLLSPFPHSHIKTQPAEIYHRNQSSTAGNWLFCFRRWRDPRNTEDLEVLEREYARLCSAFPRFADACSKDRFLSCIDDICSSWLPKTGCVAAPRECTSQQPASPLDTPVPTTLQFGLEPAGFDLAPPFMAQALTAATRAASPTAAAAGAGRRMSARAHPARTADAAPPPPHPAPTADAAASAAPTPPPSSPPAPPAGPALSPCAAAAHDAALVTAAAAAAQPDDYAGLWEVWLDEPGWECPADSETAAAAYGWPSAANPPH
jgi:hypothetical protein